MQTQIICPNCGTPYLADIHQIIDAVRQPQLKEMLLSGQLNFAVCPNCGVGGRIATPLLYHDPAHDLFMVHVPQEMNLDQVRREELIGRLVQQVIDQTPMEKRRAYMLQPQTILTMQSFMEKVWETEGVTPDMLAKQQRQVELLRTLATASEDVQNYLIKDRSRDIDETFFSILRAQIEATSQMNDSNLVVGLLNLQAKLMTQTEVGRRLEKQQIAIHAMSRDAKKAGALTPEILAKHVIANDSDDSLVNALALTGRGALTYDFFALLTSEVENREKRGDKAGAQRLGRVRDQLLQMQLEMQEAARQVLQDAQDTLDEILNARNMEEAVAENIGRIDDAFMHVLEARLIRAEQDKNQVGAEKLRQVQELVITQIQGETPPEVRMLTQLVSSAGKAERTRLMDASPELINDQLIEVVDMLIEQSDHAGQEDLARRLAEIRGELIARLAVVGDK